MPSQLEQPPPLPDQVGSPGPPPDATLQGMVGQQQGSQEQGAVSMAAKHLQEAEQALKAAAAVFPGLVSLVDGYINNFKPQAGQILFGQGGSQGQPPTPQPGIGSLLTSGATGLNMGR